MRLIELGHQAKQILLLLIGLIPLSCSFNRIMVNEAAKYMQTGRVVFEREPDLEIAEISLASNLKLLEALLQGDPQNKKMRIFLAEGYSLYSMAFVEDRYEEFRDSNPRESRAQKKRAILFYKRARNFTADLILSEMHLNSINEINRDNLEAYIKTQSKKDIPKLFWFAFSWISSVNLQRDNMEELFYIPYIEIIMNKVRELDPEYYFGGAYLFEGMIYGGRPAMLGGNMDRSLKAFNNAEEISQKSILLIPYFKAATYCVQTQSKECFMQNLNYVIDSPDDINPNQMLANALAKKKAQRLLKQEKEYFLDDVP